MKFLLDTHTFLWWANEPEKLSQKALQICQDATNDLILSVVSVWEMQIKIQLGKLKLNNPLETLVTKQKELNSLDILSVELIHVFELKNLPDFHKDPFDRLLIAQANSENIPLLSADQVFKKYPVQIIW